jgi:hypothetical protein
MNCDCGEKCFSYQKFISKGSERITVEINKCQRLSNPKYSNPKKKNCGFYSETEINKYEIIREKYVDKSKKYPLCRINHTEELNKNILQYKNCIENGLNFKNFAARIDYHLDALNYDYFDYSNETVSELINRISNSPDKIKDLHSYKKINIVSHELLPVVRKTKKISNVVKKQQKKVVDNETNQSFFDKLTKEEIENKKINQDKSLTIKYERNEEHEIQENEESELCDLIGKEEEEEQENTTYNYADDSNDDDGDFSD